MVLYVICKIFLLYFIFNNNKKIDYLLKNILFLTILKLQIYINVFVYIKVNI